MMTEPQLTRISKILSYHLRHRPDALGLTLGPGGWVAVDTLLAALAQNGKPVTRAELDEVVARNPKQRFAFDESGTRIRASQGHSVAVDLELAPVEPPAVLYHGTDVRAVASILREGLRKQQRHHVHLSSDVATALAVGTRHGRPCPDPNFAHEIVSLEPTADVLALLLGTSASGHEYGRDRHD